MDITRIVELTILCALNVGLVVCFAIKKDKEKKYCKIVNSCTLLFIIAQQFGFLLNLLNKRKQPTEIIYLCIVSIMICELINVGLLFWDKFKGHYFVVTISIMIFRFSELYIGLHMMQIDALKKTLKMFATFQGLCSVCIVLGSYMILVGVLGNGFGNLLYYLLWITLFVANYIQMKYHNSFFKPINLLLIKEVFSIANKYMSVPIKLGIVTIVVFITVLIILNRDKVKKIFYPSIETCTIIVGMLVLMTVLSGVYTDSFAAYGGISKDNIWDADSTRIRKAGFATYMFYELLRLEELFPDKPNNYSEEEITSILSEYQTESKKEAAYEQRPDVIFLMLESIFDVDVFRDYGVEYSEDPDSFTDNYVVTQTVSPVFGGYTANVEFEALTGLNTRFMPSDIVPYQTYIDNKNGYLYSIVDVFHKNGYETTAIHQNGGTFYNRINAYQTLGFDQFVKKGDYLVSPDEVLEDDFETNTCFQRLIKQQLEETDKPQFIWGITIESHGGYENKYKKTRLKSFSDKLNKKDLLELDQYIQSVKNTDIMLSELKDYIDQRGKPTLLVAFGDHWPSLQATALCSQEDTLYRTVCVAYSNFGQFDIPCEYLATNYLGAYVLYGAGITDEPFYNFLRDLSLEEQKQGNREQTSDKQVLYECLQYDILFGNEYLLQSKK